MHLTENVTYLEELAKKYGIKLVSDSEYNELLNEDAEEETELITE